MVDAVEKTFVYEGKEWTLTGRIAKKTIFHKRDMNRPIGTETIVEIAPIGIAGSDPQFHKWVAPRDLFFISDSATIDVTRLKDENENLDDEDD